MKGTVGDENSNLNESAGGSSVYSLKRHYERKSKAKKRRSTSRKQRAATIEIEPIKEETVESGALKDTFNSVNQPVDESHKENNENSIEPPSKLDSFDDSQQ